MRILTVMFLVSSWICLRVIAAVPGPDSPETNEADHSHSAGGCDCMEYWTCVMRYGACTYARRSVSVSTYMNFVKSDF
jgi:hypothetical protein